MLTGSSQNKPPLQSCTLAGGSSANPPVAVQTQQGNPPELTRAFQQGWSILAAVCSLFSIHCRARLYTGRWADLINRGKGLGGKEAVGGEGGPGRTGGLRGLMRLWFVGHEGTVGGRGGGCEGGTGAQVGSAALVCGSRGGSRGRGGGPQQQ